jgi:hypothetical protein
MIIVNPGVDHSTSDVFYASRVFVKGTSGVSLGAGWYEGAFSDADQHLYYQRSDECRGTTCFWIPVDDGCTSGQGSTLMLIYNVTSTNTRSGWCYNGDSWDAMVTGVDLGGADAVAQEVAGEVKRTVSGAMHLPGNGARFKRAQVFGSSWRVIRSGLSELQFFNSDDPYELDFNSNYYDFYVDD